MKETSKVMGSDKVLLTLVRVGPDIDHLVATIPGTGSIVLARYSRKEWTADSDGVESVAAWLLNKGKDENNGRQDDS